LEKAAATLDGLDISGFESVVVELKVELIRASSLNEGIDHYNSKFREFDGKDCPQTEPSNAQSTGGNLGYGMSDSDSEIDIAVSDHSSPSTTSQHSPQSDPFTVQPIDPNLFSIIPSTEQNIDTSVLENSPRHDTFQHYKQHDRPIKSFVAQPCINPAMLNHGQLTSMMRLDDPSSEEILWDNWYLF
jgi:hypothetical protein